MKPDLFNRAALKQELEDMFHGRVDVIRYSNGLNPYLKKRIEEEAVYA
jgi:predicted nucleotidyltransferase